MGSTKKRNKSSTPAVRGFAAASSSPRSPLAQDFARHLDAHEWDQAVRVWKRLDQGNMATPATRLEALKRLIYEGRDHMQAGLHDPAAACYCKALALDPSNLDCLRNLAMIDLASDKAEQALGLINRALSIRTDVASLWSVKVQCLGSLGRDTEALEAVEPAFALGLNRNSLLSDLATRLMKDQPDRAIAIARPLLKNADPNETTQLISLIGLSRQYACFDLEAQVDWWSAAERMDPSNIPSIILNFHALADSIEENQKLCNLLSSYGNWCKSLTTNDPLPSLESKPIGARSIRIGVMSGDFCNHVVAMFLLPLMEALDPERFELVCLSTRSRIDDDARRRFKAIASMIDLDPLQPRSAAQRAREQHLDVCVDAAGFTAYGASPAFSWRLATLQLGMIGFPGSTFIPNMDLLLADPVLAPEHKWMHPEELLLLEGLAYCMEPPDPAVQVTLHPPQSEHGFINFGILVNPYKFRKDTIRLWAEVLKATPKSQMAIVRPECRSLSFQANILKEFAKHGIPSNRVIIVNNHGRNIHYLDCYNKIDVVLDSTPMTGGTSTFEAVLMGLPVITMDGPGYHQRISKTVLKHAGLDDCIAKNELEYVKIASRMAQNVNRLTELRQRAEHLRHSSESLCDGSAYANRFEKALLQAFDQRGLLGAHWQTRLHTLMGGT